MARRQWASLLYGPAAHKRSLSGVPVLALRTVPADVGSPSPGVDAEPGVGGQARLPRVSWESRGRCHPATCPGVSQLTLGASVTASVKCRKGGKTEHGNACGHFCFQDLGSSQPLDRVGGRQEGRRGMVPAAHLLTPSVPCRMRCRGACAPWGAAAV